MSGKKKKPRLTAAHRARLEKLTLKYVATYTRLLGLERWIVDVTFDKEDADAYASCISDGDYRVARVQFDLDKMFERGVLEHLEFTVIHELSHCLMEPLRAFCDQLLEWLFEMVPPERHTEFAKKLAARMVELLDERSTVALERLPAFDPVRDSLPGKKRG